MEKKLNLHDLFGILFPGSVLCGAGYVFLVRLEWIVPRDFGLSETLTLLPLAYVMGVLIHVVGSRWFHESELALRMMDGDDKTFTPEFKEALRRAFRDVFALPADGSKANRQMVFNGCYDYAIQHGKGNYAENQYATYALCRSMVLVIGVGVLLVSVVVVREWPASVTAHPLLDLVGVFGLAFAVGAAFWTGKEKFMRAFTRSVYRTFYSAYCGARHHGSAPAAPQSADDE